MLDEVRQPLLDEGRRSPALLSDLAGLEQYVAESYDARSFVELLQNADDAGSTRFLIQRSGSVLLVANDGRPFTRTDFESLCRSAASSKSRGASIGYRGIGFKSVVGFARTVHVISGDLRATFSRERTEQAVPGASRVPLIRIPHPLEWSEERRFAAAVTQLVEEGFVTVFVFDELLARGIEREFSEFEPTSLLFLRHVRQVELRTSTNSIISVRRAPYDEQSHSVRIATAEGARDWRILTSGDFAIAFACDTSGIVRLGEREAVVHAFLPTLEPTGLGVKVHGDISTDPSRTRVVVDERTTDGIRHIAAILIGLLESCLARPRSPDSLRMASALMPVTDPRAATFQRKAFKTELLAALKEVAGDIFRGILLRPAWLNPVDFAHLAQSAGRKSVPRELEGIEGLVPLLRYLGAKEAGTDDVVGPLKGTAPSVNGAAEIVAHLARLHGTGQLDARKIRPEWRLWAVDGQTVPLDEAQRTEKSLDQDFVDMVVERHGRATELRRLLSALADTKDVERLLPDQPSLGGERIHGTAASKTGRAGGSKQIPSNGSGGLSVRKWRSAEQQVVNLLTARGWAVRDVSEQNLGYDVEGVTAEGREAFVEVKSIDRAGESFMLTSNEEAVARHKGNAYWLALVRQSDAAFELALIQDPVHELALTRQCRQWVWVCASYEFSPEVFPYA